MISSQQFITTATPMRATLSQGGPVHTVNTRIRRPTKL